MVETFGRSASESRMPVRWAVGIVATSALVFVALGEFWLDLDQQYQVLLLGAMIHATSLGAWLLAERAPRLSAWLVILVSVAAVFLGVEWLGIPGFLNLVPLPVVLAVAMADLPAGLVVTIGETVLVVLSPALGMAFAQQPPARGIAIGSIWIAYALLVALYRPVSQWSHWLEEYAASLRHFADEARGRRAELERTAESLAHANRQLALASERTATLREIAEAAQQAKTAFVANVSHEFRTPLNMIIGLVDLIIRSPGRYDVVLSPKMRNDLEIVHRNCLHLADMVDDVLDLTRTEADRLTLHRERTDLVAVVQESAAVVKPLLDDKGLYLRVLAQEGIPTVHCDRTRIRQVVLNLLSNAARFTESGGVTIEVALVDRQVRVRMTDTGAGIKPEYVERVFEPFWQGAGGGRGTTASTGLGLSISRLLVGRHGGRMWVESQPGVGTSFFFTLPVDVAPGAGVEAAHHIKADWPWREQAFRTDRSVAVEQLRKPRFIVWDETGALLPAWANYSDDIEFVGLQDLARLPDALDACPAHAVVLNVAQPERLWSLAERVRSEIRGIPVLGCSISRRVQRDTELGVLGHLVKPVAFEDLQRALRTLPSPLRRVLVVDDDTDVLQLFRGMLELYDDTLEIATAPSGAQALEALRRAPPDLMLLDIVMPNLDGWQVLEACAGNGGPRPVPTLLISAQDPAQDGCRSELMLASVDGGLSTAKLLSCSLMLSRHLVALQREPFPEPL